MAKLEVLLYPNSILRKKCDVIETVDEEVVHEWSWCLRSKDIPFKVEGQDVLLKFEVNHLSRNKQKLYVNDLVM